MQNRSDITKLLAPSNLEGDMCSEISYKNSVIKMGKRVTRNQTSKANLAGTDMDGRVTYIEARRPSCPSELLQKEPGNIHLKLQWILNRAALTEGDQLMSSPPV